MPSGVMIPCHETEKHRRRASGNRNISMEDAAHHKSDVLPLLNFLKLNVVKTRGKLYHICKRKQVLFMQGLVIISTSFHSRCFTAVSAETFMKS